MDTKKTLAAVAVVLVALAAAFAALSGIVLPRATVETPVPVEEAAPVGDVTVTVTPEGATTSTTPATPEATAVPATPVAQPVPAN